MSYSEIAIIFFLISQCLFFLWFLSKYFSFFRYILLIVSFISFGFLLIYTMNEIKGYPAHEISFDKTAVLIHAIKSDKIYYWLWEKKEKEPRVFSYDITAEREEEFRKLKEMLKRETDSVIVKYSNRKNNSKGLFDLKELNEIMEKNE